MITITSTLLSGNGTPPKDIRIGAYAELSAAGVSGSNVFWELVSSPENTIARIANPSGTAVEIGPLDTEGVYVVELYVDSGTANEKTKRYALNVLAAKSNNIPTDPSFRFNGGGIVNCTFDLPGTTYLGAFPGWDVSDLGGILNLYNGISRGTIIPTNFTPVAGDTVACLGDDSARVGGMVTQRGTVFSITQNVDLTTVTTLTVTLKAVDR